MKLVRPWDDAEASAWVQSPEASPIVDRILWAIEDARDIYHTDHFVGETVGAPEGLVMRSLSRHMSDDDIIGGQITGPDGSSPETLLGIMGLEILQDLAKLFVVSWEPCFGRRLAGERMTNAIRAKLGLQAPA